MESTPTRLSRKYSLKVTRNSKKEEAKLPISTTNEKEETDKSSKPGIKRRAASKHPPTSQMVIESIKALNLRKGVSVQAIRKYIEKHYTVDMKVLRPHFKRFLHMGVEKGILDRVKGVGATGSFKLKGAVKTTKKGLT